MYFYWGIEYLQLYVGTGGAAKTDEFWEKFQTAFYPPSPPSFPENPIAIFFL